MLYHGIEITPGGACMKSPRRTVADGDYLTCSVMHLSGLETTMEIIQHQTPLTPSALRQGISALLGEEAMPTVGTPSAERQPDNVT